jgi:hypothetical protein
MHPLAEQLVKEEASLGDGIYARFDGQHITLFLWSEARIQLDQKVFTNLVRYSLHIYEILEMLKQEDDNASRH